MLIRAAGSTEKTDELATERSSELAFDRATGRSLARRSEGRMILQGDGFVVVIFFGHDHDGRWHLHDMAVVDAEAHELAHRIERRPRRSQDKGKPPGHEDRAFLFDR